MTDEQIAPTDEEIAHKLAEMLLPAIREVFEPELLTEGGETE